MRLGWVRGARVSDAVRVCADDSPVEHRPSNLVSASTPAVAAGALAVAAIVFTPLALTTARPGPGRNHLLLYDRDIRRNFLRATLILLLCGLILIGCGSADASHSSNPTAETVASLAVGLAVMKTLRLTRCSRPSSAPAQTMNSGNAGGPAPLPPDSAKRGNGAKHAPITKDLRSSASLPVSHGCAGGR